MTEKIEMEYNLNFWDALQVLYKYEHEDRRKGKPRHIAITCEKWQRHPSKRSLFVTGVDSTPMLGTRYTDYIHGVNLKTWSVVMPTWDAVFETLWAVFEPTEPYHCAGSPEGELEFICLLANFNNEGYDRKGFLKQYNKYLVEPISEDFFLERANAAFAKM